jgi:hypothetical protein
MKQLSRPTEFNDAPFKTDDFPRDAFAELQVETYGYTIHGCQGCKAAEQTTAACRSLRSMDHVAVRGESSRFRWTRARALPGQTIRYYPAL